MLKIKYLKRVLSVTWVMIILVSCNKNEANNCVDCNVEGIQICEEEPGKIRFHINGEVIDDLYTLPTDLEFNDAAEQLCAEFEREFGVGDCYECTGPYVADFFVCKEGDNIVVNGTTISEFSGQSLETVITVLENNETDEEVFRDLTCQRN